MPPSHRPPPTRFGVLQPAVTSAGMSAAGIPHPVPPAAAVQPRMAVPAAPQPAAPAVFRPPVHVPPPVRHAPPIQPSMAAMPRMRPQTLPPPAPPFPVRLAAPAPARAMPHGAPVIQRAVSLIMDPRNPGTINNVVTNGRPEWRDRLKNHVTHHSGALGTTKVRRHVIATEHLSKFLRKQMKGLTLGEAAAWLRAQHIDVNADESQIDIQEAARTWWNDAHNREDNIWAGPKDENGHRNSLVTMLGNLIKKVWMKYLGKAKSLHDGGWTYQRASINGRHLFFRTGGNGKRLVVEMDDGTEYTMGAFLYDTKRRKLWRVSRSFDWDTWDQLTSGGGAKTKIVNPLYDGTVLPIQSGGAAGSWEYDNIEDIQSHYRTIAVDRDPNGQIFASLDTTTDGTPILAPLSTTGTANVRTRHYASSSKTYNVATYSPNYRMKKDSRDSILNAAHSSGKYGEF
jgi:hypothetical protein